eukprot:scaffold334_cov241-Pinguiococcus_pyrenoidosus.AAC.4
MAPRRLSISVSSPRSRRSEHCESSSAAAASQSAHRFGRRPLLDVDAQGRSQSASESFGRNLRAQPVELLEQGYGETARCDGRVGEDSLQFRIADLLCVNVILLGKGVGELHVAVGCFQNLGHQLQQVGRGSLPALLKPRVVKCDAQAAQLRPPKGVRLEQEALALEVLMLPRLTRGDADVAKALQASKITPAAADEALEHAKRDLLGQG